MASKRSRQSGDKTAPLPAPVLGDGTETAVASMQGAFDNPKTAGANTTSATIPKRNGAATTHASLGLGRNELQHALRTMMLARRTDEKHLMLLKQNKSFFHSGGSGHEAIQVGIAHWMNPESDWAWTYYRDLAMTYA